jgi:hypothetical protein
MISSTTDPGDHFEDKTRTNKFSINFTVDYSTGPAEPLLCSINKDRSPEKKIRVQGILNIGQSTDHDPRCYLV